MMENARKMKARVFQRRPLLAVSAALYGMFWLWMAVAPSSRMHWLLENLLVFLALGLLAAAYRRYPLSDASYALILFFLALHAYGAHSSYGPTAVDPWLQAVFGEGRAPYDRLVHLAYGLLIAGPLHEAMSRYSGLSHVSASVGAVVLILATGAFYELIEMWAALTIAPELGTLFVGAQGDPWDAQRDMELELYGAAAAVLLGGVRRRWRGTAGTAA